MVPWITAWKVQLESKAEKDLTEKLKLRVITKDDLAVIKAWVTTIEESGPDYIATTAASHWNDHPLFGDRTGQRSSSFSDAGRIIYRVDEKNHVIIVLRVTDDHDYSTKGKK